MYLHRHHTEQFRASHLLPQQVHAAQPCGSSRVSALSARDMQASWWRSLTFPSHSGGEKRLCRVGKMFSPVLAWSDSDSLPLRRALFVEESRLGRVKMVGR